MKKEKQPQRNYILLKDLHNVNAGTEIFWVADRQKYGCFGKNGHTASFNKFLIENNPEWFEEVKDVQKLPERIEVINIEYIDEGFSNSISFLPTNEIAKDKFPAIKQAIEQALNSKEEDKGSKIVCTVQVGMIVQYMEDGNWDKLGTVATVMNIDWEKDNVLTSDKQNHSIGGFLEKIERGRYKVLHYPTPLPETPSPQKDNQEWEIVSFKVKNVGDGFDGQILPKVGGYFGIKEFHVTEEDLLKSKIHYINSVRRPSDGEVFTVGDVVVHKNNVSNKNGVIESFRILNHGNAKPLFVRTNNYDVPFCYINPSSPKPTPTNVEQQTINNADVACLSFNDLKQCFKGTNILWDNLELVEQFIKEKLKINR